MKFIEWQFYWTRWHLGVFKTLDEIMPGYSVTEYIIFIGPLQIRVRK